MWMHTWNCHTYECIDWYPWFLSLVLVGRAFVSTQHGDQRSLIDATCWLSTSIDWPTFGNKHIDIYIFEGGIDTACERVLQHPHLYIKSWVLGWDWWVWAGLSWVVLLGDQVQLTDKPYLCDIDRSCTLSDWAIDVISRLWMVNWGLRWHVDRFAYCGPLRS